MIETQKTTVRNCACEVCQKAREMVNNNYAHYLCKPANQLLDNHSEGIREQAETPIEMMSKADIVVYLMKSFETTQYGRDALDYYNKMLLRLVD